MYHADLKELVQPKMKNLSNWKSVFPVTSVIVVSYTLL